MISNPNLLLSIASLSEVIGGILIAFVVLGVHQHIAKERSIDADVLRTMRKEKAYIVLGICLLIISFLLEIWVRLVADGAIV